MWPTAQTFSSRWNLRFTAAAGSGSMRTPSELQLAVLGVLATDVVGVATEPVPLVLSPLAQGLPLRYQELR